MCVVHPNIAPPRVVAKRVGEDGLDTAWTFRVPLRRGRIARRMRRAERGHVDLDGRRDAKIPGRRQRDAGLGRGERKARLRKLSDLPEDFACRRDIERGFALDWRGARSAKVWRPVCVRGLRAGWARFRRSRFLSHVRLRSRTLRPRRGSATDSENKGLNHQDVSRTPTSCKHWTTFRTVANQRLY
jgi:hypothetical protein